MVDDVEWDPRKAARNPKKHGGDFADAATVLHDEQAITVREDDEDEERYVTMGMDALGNVAESAGWRSGLLHARHGSPFESTTICFSGFANRSTRLAVGVIRFS